MKKADLGIIAAVLVIAAAFLITAWMRKEGSEAVLYHDQEELGRYPLIQERTIPVQLPEGYNEVVISRGEVYVKEADCDNQICVRTPAISRAGETIVCLPHRFYVMIERHGY